MRRLVLNTVTPYISHTKTHLLEFIQRPDDRQQILHEFQTTFNAISECLRSDDEVKAELQCRADELRKALQATSEQNIMQSFGERERIIEQHWLRKELHELTQIYLCAMQLELDRFVGEIYCFLLFLWSKLSYLCPLSYVYISEYFNFYKIRNWKLIDLDNVQKYIFRTICFETTENEILIFILRNWWSVLQQHVQCQKLNRVMHFCHFFITIAFFVPEIYIWEFFQIQFSYSQIITSLG